MKNGTRIILIVIIIVLMLAIAGSYAYCMVQKYADAEYADIVGTSDIVNFNQLMSINSVNGGNKDNDYVVYWTSNVDSAVATLNYTINIQANHKYYWSVKDSSGNEYNMFNLSGNVNFRPNQISQITGSFPATTINRLNWYNEIPLNISLNFIFVDLTQMFGGGNEPNYDQADKYFTASYYNYTTGTPMAYNGLDNYYQAINDVFSNYSYTLNRNALNTTTYYYDITENPDGTFAYNDVNWYVYGAMAMPLFTTIKSGAQFSITYQLYAPNLPDGYQNICFAKLDTNGERLELGMQPYNGEINTFSLVLPVDVSTIVCYARNPDTNEIEDMNYIVGKLEIKASQIDVAGAILSAYDSGYQYVMDLYEVGGINWHSIYDAGYFKGQEDGSAVLTAMDYVKAAFVKLGEILMIEVFPNITLGAFFLFPIITSLIFFVFKLVKGGGD